MSGRDSCQCLFCSTRIGARGGLSAFVESFAHLFTSVCAPVCGCVLSGLADLAMASDYHSVEIVDRKPFSGMQNRVRALF